jgi:hypothetical protein
MEEIVHLRIKKKYAADLIQDLIEAKALEPVTEPDVVIPEWQKEAVRQTLADVMENPGRLQPWDLIRQKYMKA